MKLLAVVTALYIYQNLFMIIYLSTVGLGPAIVSDLGILFGAVGVAGAFMEGSCQYIKLKWRKIAQLQHACSPQLQP